MARHRRAAESFVEERGPDLTPLIDCVFQLLIFFMVTTAFIHARGLDVDLPGKGETAEQREKKDINVVIDREGRVEIGGEEIADVDLEARLRRAMEQAHNDNIIIQADRECIQQYVVRVVDAAKAVGVKGIAFVKETKE